MNYSKKRKLLFITICILALFQLNATNTSYSNRDLRYKDFSSFNQTILLGYNVSFPLINNQMLINPCEIYVGMLSKVGVYVKGKTNFNFRSGYKIPLGFNPNFREIEKIKWQRYGGLVGVYMLTIEPVYLNFGIGYGSRRQQMDVTCYESSRGLYAEKYYYNKYNSIELEAGVMVKISMLTVSVGAAMLPIGGKSPYFEVNAGVGMALGLLK
ncbi:MAG: hypothetical protein GX330_08975 [Bacteroidales bacterium]|nr:hypothetical protein [Bacteroidales bacterium]